MITANLFNNGYRGVPILISWRQSFWGLTVLVVRVTFKWPNGEEITDSWYNDNITSHDTWTVGHCLQFLFQCLQGLFIHFLQLVNKVLIFALAHGQVGAAQHADGGEDRDGGWSLPSRRWNPLLMIEPTSSPTGQTSSQSLEPAWSSKIQSSASYLETYTTATDNFLRSATVNIWLLVHSLPQSALELTLKVNKSAEPSQHLLNWGLRIFFSVLQNSFIVRATRDSFSESYNNSFNITNLLSISTNQII